MFIKATRPAVCGPNLSLTVGQVYDLPNEQASLLISMGKAVRVSPPPAPPAPAPVAEEVIAPSVAPIERAVVAPHAKATKRRVK